MRKQLFSIVLILLYLVALIKPLIPTLIYYANYDYIVTELCENKDKPEMQCHGTCYLKKLQNKVEPRTDNNKPISKEFMLQRDFPITLSNVDLYKSIDSLIENKRIIPNFSKHFVISEYSTSIFHPPKVLS